MHRVLIVSQSTPPKMGGSAIAAMRYGEFLYHQDATSVKLLAPFNTDWTTTLQNKYPFVETVKVPYFDKLVGKGKLGLLKARIHYFVIFLKTFWKMAKMRNQYDQVHLFDCWLDFNFCAIRAGKLLGKKVYVETCLMGADDPDTIIGKGKKAKNSMDWVRMRDYLRADIYISKSAFMNEVFDKYFPREKYKTIPYFVDTSKFFPANLDTIKVLREKYDLPTEKKIILFVGAINGRKGAKYLVDAFISFHGENKNYFLLLVSPINHKIGELEKTVLESLESVGSENYRVYTRVIDFVPDLMRLTNIFCLPSFQEGFPISICEAMCCEKFIIASDIKEIKDQQIKDKITGYLCQAGDVDSIIDGLEYYKNNSIEVNEISNRAYIFGKSNFALEIVQRKYRSLYDI